MILASSVVMMTTGKEELLGAEPQAPTSITVVGYRGAAPWVLVFSRLRNELRKHG
jgi:hypothetical protein